MTTQPFDETKHPRDPSGQFTSKPAAETEVSLASAAEDGTDLAARAREALTRWDSTPGGLRGRPMTTLRTDESPSVELRPWSRHALDDARDTIAAGLDSQEARTRRATWLTAARVRSDEVGLSEDDHVAVMRALAPDRTADEVWDGYCETEHALVRAGEMATGSRPDARDEEVLAEAESRGEVPARLSGSDRYAQAWEERARQVTHELIPDPADDQARLSMRAREAMTRWDSTPGGIHGQLQSDSTGRRLVVRPWSAGGLEQAQDVIRRGLDSGSVGDRQVAYVTAGRTRIGRVGLSDKDHHAVMRALAPDRSDQEVWDSYKEMESATMRSLDMAQGAQPPDEQDDAMLRSVEARGGHVSHQLVGTQKYAAAWSASLWHTAERLVPGKG